MSNRPFPDADPPVRPEDLRQAGTWLVQHGLADARPTPLLATRLMVRRRARLAGHVMLAALIMAAALAQAYGMFWSHPPMPLLVLAASTVGFLLVRLLLDRWVRRVDRRAAATLSRRAAHPLQPGWRALLGRPYATFAAASFAGAVVLALSALIVRDPAVWYAVAILLVGLFGVGIGAALQLYDLLVRPVVAEDEVSLTADVIMRIEDARELTTPTVLWALPVVLLFGSAPEWWNAAALVFMLLGLVTCVVIQARTPSSLTAARQAMSVQ